MTSLVMGLPGGMEWVILLVVALLLFGGSRIAGMGKGAGRAIREFREEVKASTDTYGPKAAGPGVAKPVHAETVTKDPRTQA